MFNMQKVCEDLHTGGITRCILHVEFPCCILLLTLVLGGKVCGCLMDHKMHTCLGKIPNKQTKR